MKSRRTFLRNSALTALGSGLVFSTPLEAIARLRKTVSPNDKIRMGLIGCNGMGWSDMSSLLKLSEVDCVALCDVDENVLRKRTADVEKITGKKPNVYTDYRKMLDAKELDAVVIGTPDHWHCLPFVDACEMGLDIYSEKPLANSIGECYIMENAAKKHNRIVQIGQWQRSTPHFMSAIDYIHSGKLGNIRTVKVWAYMAWMKSIPVQPDSNAPEGVDYNFWLGPAKERPFNPNRFHFNFRWYWDYAGGLMTDWGVHLVDIALWGMNAKAPKSIMSAGGKFAYPNDAMETPDTQQAIYEYDNFNMLWDHAVGIDGIHHNRNHGIEFVGNNGTLVVDRGGWEVFPEQSGSGNKKEYLIEKIPVRNNEGSGLDEHTKNFVDCMKSRNQTRCNAETGSIAAINAHMGNIAFKTNQKIFWDNKARKFINNEMANNQLYPEYRKPWKLPKNY
ncbi:MAG: Gfo/Idh/MocA family oxidoreductase [Cyclobacteriaceae bacterium]|nr:Gfo/Idh/MocA family oxidoreductase [Cyclobacteriaceae bacterium]